MRLIFLIGSFFLFSAVSGQEVITLQFCLDRVKNNSIQTVTESSLLNSSQVNSQYHWWSLLPNLSAYAGVNTSFGRRLDPFTNTFATSSVNSQSFGLNSSVTLFNGFNYFYKRNILTGTIKRNEITLTAKLNELRIQVIETYVTLCKLSTQTKMAESRIEKYKQIQAIQRLLIQEGRINSIDTLKSNNSLLNEQDLLLNLSNELRLNTIQLSFQIGLPLSANYTFDLASISSINDKLTFSEKYNIESLEIESEILESQLKSDRSNIVPTIALNGLVGTGFSTNNKDYLIPGSPTKRYGDQINQNLYEGIGFYLSVPIFNRGEWLKTKRLNTIKQTEIANKKQLAELSFEKQKLELEQKLLNIRAKQEQTREMTNNLELIYKKSLLLYEEGRITYTEIEISFMDWQMKLLEYESLKLDYEKLKIYE
ncbi:TolC family protein [Fluviicola chungangensis]|uniref:TolC family protein n=1 Tax=Fluviicola chungangensis TaxID=2597671 RepID=A0A556MMW6_9FLAO|nr:TolC family protein [Fluviicola chungangensis]TSJ41162.1 TolC family protein [Fluviicola chungangensis]